jgi:hypothetical protein
MKWFKHISDSLDDPFIFELMREFKSDGYVVFFGVLEIYSREYKPEIGWKLVTIPSYFRQKLHISQSKVKKILLKIHKWEVEYKDDQVIIFIPKFKELMDDWSKRGLRSHSVVTPKILNADKEEDKEEYKDIKKGNKYTDDFLKFWECYPKKIGKDAAWKAWIKRNGDRPEISSLIKSLSIHKVSPGWTKESGQFIPNPATWLNQGRWADEIVDTKPKSDPFKD